VMNGCAIFAECCFLCLSLLMGLGLYPVEGVSVALWCCVVVWFSPGFPLINWASSS
jgi:hypothetical protein